MNNNNNYHKNLYNIILTLTMYEILYHKENNFLFPIIICPWRKIRLLPSIICYFFSFFPFLLLSSREKKIEALSVKHTHALPKERPNEQTKKKKRRKIK